MRPLAALVAGATLLAAAGGCAGDGAPGTTSPSATHDAGAACPALAPEAVAGEVDERMELRSGSDEACLYVALDPASPASVRVTVDLAVPDPVAADAAARGACGGEPVAYDVGPRSFACGTRAGGRAHVVVDGVAVLVEVRGLGGAVTATAAAGELIRAVTVPGDA